MITYMYQLNIICEARGVKAAAKRILIKNLKHTEAL